MLDCCEVHQKSVFLEESSNQFESIRKEMIEISNRLKEIWSGEDANVFFQKFDSYLEHLQAVSNYLLDKSSLFEKASSLHDRTDTTLKEKVQRRDMNGKNSNF